MATETLEVDAAATISQWSVAGPTGTTKVSAVATNDSDSTYVTGNAVTTQQWTVANPVNIGASDTINSVTLHWVGRRTTSGGTMRTWALAEVDGMSGDVNNGNTLWPLTYSAQSVTWTTRPDGAAWTLSNIQNMRVGFSNGSGTGFARCTRTYVVIDYTPSASSSSNTGGMFMAFIA